MQGLKIAAVAVVAHALWNMGRAPCPDWIRRGLALGAAAAMLLMPSPLMQLGVIAIGALIGWRSLTALGHGDVDSLHVPIPRRVAVVALLLLLVLLVGMPIISAVWSIQGLALADAFFRTGALVFGGGHVVLPMLQAEVVPPGWVNNDTFTAGYGAAQAVPGPLFTFAAYLGAVMTLPPNGWLGALLCTVAIFLPSFLLVTGVLPFWGQLRGFLVVRRALMGVNAAVVGLLLAALYDPVWTSGIHKPADLLLAIGAFALLQSQRAPPWLVVALCALLSGVVSI